MEKPSGAMVSRTRTRRKRRRAASCWARRRSWRSGMGDSGAWRRATSCSPGTRTLTPGPRTAGSPSSTLPSPRKSPRSICSNPILSPSKMKKIPLSVCGGIFFYLWKWIGCRSQLVCKMTGDTVNKTEEHIWKHINGRRFQNKLEQKEVEKLASAEVVEKDAKQSKKPSKSSTKAMKKDQKKKDGENAPPTRKSNANNSDSEQPDFWVPPIGSRWDFDDGRDRWESCTSSGHETGDGTGLDEVEEKDDPESGELTMQTKRMSIAVGPSSFASRKKKIKKASANPQNDK
ncbi:hypothetical protein COCNU_scaffold068566G000010 [Cocos nucifera]|nr:hypothetical protein [Cocos nucifera]